MLHRSQTCGAGGRNETRTRAMYGALELAVTMLDEIGASRAGKGKRT
jgi:hypothetical protein